MKKLKKSIEKDIYNKLNDIIDKYIEKGVSMKDTIKHLKKKKIFTKVLKNIGNSNIEHFKSDLDYENYIKITLKDVLEDRKVMDLDNITEKHIILDCDIYNEIVENKNTDK